MKQQETIPPIYSVSDITGDVKSILESAFDSIWVEGEISNLRIAGSQHAYFVLKDDRSQIRCVLFKGYRAGLKIQPEDGDQFILFGRVTVYESRGEYQLIVENMEPRGLGALQKSFEQLKNRLSEEGLFNEGNKKKIPEFPWKVGVVTSSTGAAIRDILNVIQRRNPKVSVLVYPVKVQGEGAAAQISEAIQHMNGINDIDVLIIGRGGGSIEDLWAFNEEIVARAISKSTIPVVSAVGHEIDFTISDFVSDLRAPTPSAAAELVVPVLDEKTQKLNEMTGQLLKIIRNKTLKYEDLLKSFVNRRFFKDPMNVLQPHTQCLDDLNNRLFRGLDIWVLIQGEKLSGMIHQLLRLTPEKNIAQFKEKTELLQNRLIHDIDSILRSEKIRLDSVLKNLNALSPLSILDRGYSITNFQGKAITRSDQIQPKDSVTIHLARGQLDCTVNRVIPSDSKINK
jgi:exodeoxyribonuclease VII large subunit